MRWPACLLLILWSAELSSPCLAADPFASAIRPTEALSPEQELQSLHVPAGFRVQLFAAEPQILKPLNMAFDGAGRLWVTGTRDYPFPNLEQPGDSIRILEDTNGDGSADRVTTFVEGITVPMGLLPYGDGVIAYSVPNICYFRDTDGDGKCDRRDVLYGPFDYSRDTHGMQNAFRRGFDGWIYACHGFANQSQVSGTDGHTVHLQSGNTYRFRADGSRIEQYTYGQINPFGMTFDHRGDLFDSDCHTKPLMLLLKDGQYPGFGRQHDGLGFVPEVMRHSHGSTAIAGVTQLTGAHWPAEFRDNFLAGNVMTSRLNRDSLNYAGSSMTAVEEPDFLIADDPWFRPVDLQLGPDGALYVADFYNKIIGHYEVPLTHPERDRLRGRIWRITYVGNDSATAASIDGNLRTAALPELISASGSQNLTRRMRAMDEISDRLGTEAAADVFKALSEADDSTRISLLWVLHRWQRLDIAHLLEAASHSAPIVRTHAMRILADRANWNEQLRAAALGGLQDADPFVQRAAAAALADHPQAVILSPLLDCFLKHQNTDPMLAHQLKIALRNQLQQPEALAWINAQQWSPDQRRVLTMVSLGADSPAAAHFLLSVFVDPQFQPDQSAAIVERIARWGADDEQRQLLDSIRLRYRNDIELQLELLTAARRGLQLQGKVPPAEYRLWAEQIAGSILHRRDPATDWAIVAASGKPTPIWDDEHRRSVNLGTPELLVSSLPGGESATSTLRSPVFTIPETLSFLVCGHLGFPDQPAQPVNYVRLCLQSSGEEIARALAPRNDVAAPVQWNLRSHAGEAGYLEVVDGLDLTAYAWIAFGRLEPAVIPMPAGTLSRGQKLLQGACGLLIDWKLAGWSEELRELVGNVHLPIETRIAAARVLSERQGTSLAAGLAAICVSPALSAAQLAKVQTGLAADCPPETQLEILTELTRTSAMRVQVEIAQALLSRDEGADLLLKLCESGVMSPRVLESSVIRPRLESRKDARLSERAQNLLSTLPPASAAREAQIKALSGRFAAAAGSAAEGRLVFTTRCAACHQVQGNGKLVGPQLDGIGNRGAERLFEDILDPNRNVDHSFRTHTYALEDGRIINGILRRREGPLIVLANNKGEEISFAADAVEEESISTMSIMPDNWGEILPENELLQLMAFLLEQRK